MRIINKVWDINKRYLHTLMIYAGKEIHHIFGRIGIAKCCLRLLCPEVFGHTDSWERMQKLREERKGDYEKAKLNWVKYLGCQRKIFKECDKCAMFLVLAKEKKKG